eukprot:13346650-Ditylum_brightwellii.AAC.1
MANILDAFRRHLIPFLVLVVAIILVMTILITVDAVHRFGKGLITLILDPVLLLLDPIFCREEWTAFSTAA